MNQARAMAVQRPLWRSALRVALAYAGIALAWIFVTDIAVSHGQFSSVTIWSLAKGVFFVLVTATLLFFFVRAALRELQLSEQQLRISEERYQRVTESNKRAYVDLIARHRMTTSIRPQLEAFLEGFWQLVPQVGHVSSSLAPSPRRTLTSTDPW